MQEFKEENSLWVFFKEAGRVFIGKTNHFTSYLFWMMGRNRDVNVMKHLPLTSYSADTVLYVMLKTELVEE